MRSSVAWIALLLSTAAAGRGVSPYLPLKLSPEIERDIERVLLLGNQAVLARPISAARVLDALPAACQRDKPLCTRVRRYLQRFMTGVNVVHASVDGAYTDGVSNPVPNQHGLLSDSPWQASVSAYGQLGDYVLLNVGGVGNDEDVVATGSFLSLGMHYAQLDIGFRDHWYSPMTDSSMLISTNATTMPSVTLSNYQPITGLGLGYELFVAEMSESSKIAYLGGTTTGNPILSGIHLRSEPVPGWAIAATRLLQSGGGARKNPSGKDYLRALFETREYDNANPSLEAESEYGNQTAAWSSRMVFPGRTPFAVYFEYAGEDTSFSGNYRLGNAALSIGMDFPRLWNAFDFTIEASEWQNSWYVHSIYGDGMREDGRAIGHWGGDARRLGDGVGGYSAMARIGWRPSFGGIAELRYRTIKNEAYSLGDYQRGQEGMLSYAYPWRSAVVGVEAAAGTDVFGDSYARVAAFARLGADFTGGRVEDDDIEDDPTGADGIDYFIDAGGSASRLRIERSDGNPKHVTDASYAPHIAIGARRAVSERSDLGARIEIDSVEDSTLIAVRALDYRYRFGSHVAASFFAGAARYDLATPAYGYYGGIGLQWRKLLRNVDVGLDVRYGDKLARDHLLPGEQPVGPRDDMFFDLFGATLYLSYGL